MIQPTQTPTTPLGVSLPYSQHKDGTFIILGLKDPDNNLYTFVSGYRSLAIVPVSIGEKTVVSQFSPYPFETFSSLDDDKTNGWAHAYLEVKVETPPSDTQLAGMKSSGIVYHQFGPKTVTVLAEYQTPFQYAAQYLKEVGDRLGTYDLKTWVVSESVRSQDEYTAMTEILTQAISECIVRKQPFDISLDKGTLRYVSFLREKSDTVAITIGNYGHTRVTPEHIQEAEKAGYLSEEDLLFLVRRIWNIKPLLAHSAFDLSFFKRHLEGTPEVRRLTTDLSRTDIPVVRDLGFDMAFLFRAFHAIWLDSSYYDRDDAKYLTYKDLVTDTAYVEKEDRYDPYEYYCCPDCDGYPYPDDEAYDYTVDEQVMVLQDLVETWGDVLDDALLPVFAVWSPAVFSRAAAESDCQPFIAILAQTYPVKEDN